MDLSGTTAIITGGAGLLGRTYTAALLEIGAEVIIIDKKIDSKNIQKLIKNESKMEQKKINNLKLIDNHFLYSKCHLHLKSIHQPFIISCIC